MRLLALVLTLPVLVTSLTLPAAPRSPLPGVPDGDWWAENAACKVCGQDRKPGEAHDSCMAVYYSFVPVHETALASAAPDWFTEPASSEEPRRSGRPPKSFAFARPNLPPDPPLKVPIS